MTPRERVPVTGWDDLPTPSDKSTGADLARIKWYRNMLAHHGDGKLSPTDFSQYWGDLEGAILRLGGPLLLNESRSAQHIVLDTSLTDILNKLRLSEISKEENISQINDLKTTLESQVSFIEKHENQFQQLQDSLQKGETETNSLASKLSDTTVLTAKSEEEIKACKKEMKKNEERIEVVQEKMANKQIQIDKLITQVAKLEIQYEQHDKVLTQHSEHLAKHNRQLTKNDEQMAKQNEEVVKHKEQMENHELQLARHDGQMATHDEQMLKHDSQLQKHVEQISTNATDIDYLKMKLHDDDDSSNESKRKRLLDDTKALIDEDIREGTFVTTQAVKDSLLILKQNGVVLITGHAGTGKSRISRHIIHMFCSENTSYKCIKLNKLQEWEDMVSRKDKVLVLLDDIFGETNCIYNREKDIPILDKVHAYMCKGNIKVMITIRDTVKRQCQDVLDSHRLFKFDFVDLSSDKYKLCKTEKQDILTIYMKTVLQSDFLILNERFVDHNGTTILEKGEISRIIMENPVKGFPLVVYQFVHNEKYFQLGSKFFDRPTEAMMDEINEIRCQGEIHKKFTIQYGVMVYTAINENGINPDDISHVTEVAKIIDAVYGETITMKKCHISDAVKELKGSYLVKIPNKKYYRYHHPTLQESVILSFAKIDDENMKMIIPLINWPFFLKMVKPDAYEENEGEVVLRIPANTYKLLAYTLVDMYMAEFRLSVFRIHDFVNDLNDTEIFQEENCVLLTYLLDAIEKTDYEDNYIENMIRSNDLTMSNNYLPYMKNKDVFLALLLVILSTKEERYEMFQFVLQKINQIFRTENNHFTIDYMNIALITSLYHICSMKDVRSVKRVKDLLDIVEKNKIPILLDHNIKFANVKFPKIGCSMSDYYGSDSTCVFLSLCLVNAYNITNIPLLEYLLLRYNDTPFDANSFLMFFYSEYVERRLSSLSHKSLKWMLEKFEDRELIDIEFILKTACQCQMLDTVKYLASKCKTFDAISGLKWSLFLGHFTYDLKQSIYDADLMRCRKDMFNFLFSKIENASTDLSSIVTLILQKQHVPDYIFDAFLPVCLNNKDILTLACKNTHVYAAIQIMEKSQNVDFQTALSSCFITQIDNPIIRLRQTYENHMIEDEQLQIIKYIVEKIGYEQFDLIAVCHQAFHYKKFRIIEWFAENIDVALFNVDFIRNSVLEKGGLDILEHMLNKHELPLFEKRKILKSIVNRYTSVCSTKILEIFSDVWYNTDNKQELEIEKIVTAAYDKECINLLMWIYENCNSYISTNVSNLLILACENGRVEVANWVLQAYESILQDIDGGKLFISACDKMMNSDCFKLERISTIHWVLQHFQIKPFDLKSGLIRLISPQDSDVWDNIWKNKDGLNKFLDLVVSIFEKCLDCLCAKDLQEVINESLDQKFDVLVNCSLDNDSLHSFDKQDILNKVCAGAAFKTIKRLSKYFSSLDMNSAMINACTSSPDYLFVNETSDSIVACLNFLWIETDHVSIDISRIVSTVCKEEDVLDNVMTWILENFQHDLIPINEVLISCCKQGKLYHVKYILHKIDNEHLDIKEAFCHICRHFEFWLYSPFELRHVNVMVVDALFQRLHDKNSSLSVILNELFLEKSYDLILYFLKLGYCRSIDMKNLMNQACSLGHVKLVQWILENVQRKELDVKSAFHEACNSKYLTWQLHCVALIWHYIQDIHMLDFKNVLKTITEAQFNMTNSMEDIMIRKKNMSLQKGRLVNWIISIKNINQRKKSKSETLMLNTEENKA